jgi:hypothetical protein
MQNRTGLRGMFHTSKAHSSIHSAGKKKKKSKIHVVHWSLFFFFFFVQVYMCKCHVCLCMFYGWLLKQVGWRFMLI